MDPFIGQIQPFGFNFPPRGWSQCNGQLLSIAANSALFSLLGTTFGGDGRTTFALPDLRGRSIVHTGIGPGLSPIQWGQKGGVENVTLTLLNLPSHSHTLASGVVNGSIPTNAGGSLINESGNNENKLASGGSQLDIFMDGGTAAGSLGVNIAGSTSNSGGNQSFSNRNPYLGINVCIAMVGIFPSRN